jgi:hypothetical protein
MIIYIFILVRATVNSKRKLDQVHSRKKAACKNDIIQQDSLRAHDGIEIVSLLTVTRTPRGVNLSVDPRSETQSNCRYLQRNSLHPAETHRACSFQRPF